MDPHDKSDNFRTDIRIGSAASLTFLEDGAVDLIVTSPPYWNARKYDEHQKGTKRYKKRDYTKAGYASYEEYLSLMTRCFSEAFRVTKPGGVCCVVVSGVLYQRRHYPIPADLSKRLREIGWEQREELVWDKCHSACERFGTFAKHRRPHDYYPNLHTERILIFAKPGPNPRESVDPEVCEASRMPLTKLATREISGDVWHIAASRHGEQDHPAIYPQDLVARLVLMYSYRGELVLDPFTGSGQTMVVANAYGRRFVGVDIEPSFVKTARSRIGEPVRIRKKQLVVRCEHIEDDPFLEPGRSGVRTHAGESEEGSAEPR